jgi:hypothetical protein
MCGASQQQQQISDAQQQMYQTLNQNYATTFGQDQAITGALTSAFTPILQAGPSQTGFSAGEDTALRTQNTEATATDYAQAQRATANILASQGGGNMPQASSVNANALAANANAMAQQRAAGELGITKANYAQGYSNWQQAASVLSNTAGLINPLGYAGASTNAGGAAASTANQISQANMSPWTAAIGAVGALGGAALGNWQNLFPSAAKATAAPVTPWQGATTPTPLYSGPAMPGSAAPLPLY